MAAPGKHTFEREGVQGLCEAAGYEDERVRKLAEILIAGSDGAYIVENLIRALRSGGKEERNRVTRCLVRIGTPAVSSLVALLSDENWVLRYRAAEALGGIGDAAGVPALVTALSDPKDHVRYMAAKGLVGFADARAEHQLIRLLGDENPYVRSMAGRALSALGSAEACEAISRAKSQEKDADVVSALGASLQACESRLKKEP
ncbi:MAG: HEAT repeat domain-containing protein [Methanomicrobiales archaeon]|nr:HEAT repeat domain-containing protein [Methanomicrobiales archaeon]